jgi:hypothetical protein
MSNDATQTQTALEAEGSGPAEPKSKPAQPAEYMVLRRAEDLDNGPEAWLALGTAKGVNANQAIGKLAGDEPDGTFVAVPARSWRPVSPTVKVERKVSWS